MYIYLYTCITCRFIAGVTYPCSHHVYTLIILISIICIGTNVKDIDSRILKNILIRKCSEAGYRRLTKN